MNSISRKGQVALITGGGSGIGLAITRRFHEMGMKVVLASRRIDLLKEEVESLNADAQGRAMALEMNVRSRSSVFEAVASLPGEFSDIDILVNNAGLGVQDLLEDCTDEQWDLVIETTLKGPFLVTQAVLPVMKSKKSGFILNISSQAGKYGYPLAGLYCAAKFGLMGFAKSLLEEVREHGIQVHNLMPGLVQVPAPEEGEQGKDGWLQTSDLADAAEYVVTRPQRVCLEDIGLVGQPLVS